MNKKELPKQIESSDKQNQCDVSEGRFSNRKALVLLILALSIGFCLLFTGCRTVFKSIVAISDAAANSSSDSNSEEEQSSSSSAQNSAIEKKTHQALENKSVFLLNEGM